MPAGRRPDGQAHFTKKGSRGWTSCPVGGTRASQSLSVYTQPNSCHRDKSSSSVGWRDVDRVTLWLL